VPTNDWICDRLVVAVNKETQWCHKRQVASVLQRLQTNQSPVYNAV